MVFDIMKMLNMCVTCNPCVVIFIEIDYIH